MSQLNCKEDSGYCFFGNYKVKCGMLCPALASRQKTEFLSVAKCLLFQAGVGCFILYFCPFPFFLI